MNLFYKESKSKRKKRGMARVSDFFLQRIQILVFFWRGGVEGGGGRWTDRRTGPNQFAPSTSSKLGA